MGDLKGAEQTWPGGRVDGHSLHGPRNMLLHSDRTTTAPPRPQDQGPHGASAPGLGAGQSERRSFRAEGPITPSSSAPQFTEEDMGGFHTQNKTKSGTRCFLQTLIIVALGASHRPCLSCRPPPIPAPVHPPVSLVVHAGCTRRERYRQPHIRTWRHKKQVSVFLTLRWWHWLGTTAAETWCPGQ